MIPLNGVDREMIKRVLVTVFTVDQLHKQLADLNVSMRGVMGDHALGTANQYKKILEDAIKEKSRSVNLSGTVPSPTTGTIRRKAVLKNPKP